jgi:hypothetical protein
MAIKNKSGPHKPKISLNKACRRFSLFTFVMSSIKNGCREGGGRCCCIDEVGEILKDPDIWTDLFARIKDSPSGQPRFSLNGVRLHLLGFGGYRQGNFKPLDDILGLLESERIISIIEDSGVLGH